MTGFEKRLRKIISLSLVSCAVFLASPSAFSQTPAKQLFGAKSAPANLQARSLGSYARGCLAGGVPLAVDGPNWQAMRLSRNRNWGHPVLIDFMEKLAADAADKDGWPGLLVGDLSQPRGGPMLTGHRSHQIGLDADIWLRPMPNRRFTNQERESVSAISMLKPGTRTINPRTWTPKHALVIRRAALDPRLARIFVHPAIKKAMCDMRWNDRTWLRKVRPWYGHHYHFHVRLSCPPGQQGCSNQAPPPAGDGCGSELAWWLGPEPWRPSDTPSAPRRELTLADLPNTCGQVLQADNAAYVPPPANAPAALPVPMTAPATLAPTSAPTTTAPPAQRVDAPGGSIFQRALGLNRGLGGQGNASPQQQGYEPAENIPLPPDRPSR